MSHYGFLPLMVILITASLFSKMCSIATRGSLAMTPSVSAVIICDADEPCSVNTAYAPESSFKMSPQIQANCVLRLPILRWVSQLLLIGFLQGIADGIRTSNNQSSSGFDYELELFIVWIAEVHSFQIVWLYCASFSCSVTRSTTMEFQYNDIMMKTTV